jgi:hypothetical protein
LASLTGDWMAATSEAPPTASTASASKINSRSADEAEAGLVGGIEAFAPSSTGPKSTSSAVVRARVAQMRAALKT